MTPAFALDLTDAATMPQARALHDALGSLTMPVFFDAAVRQWRLAGARDIARLGRAPRRFDRWSDGLRRLGGYAHGQPLPSGFLGLVEPSLFSAQAALALPALFDAIRGPRIALLHALSPLQQPESSPRSLVARLAAYAHELRAFDGIVADSEEARTTLLGYWAWLGFYATPPVIVLSLAKPVDLLAWMQSLPAR